MESTKQMLETIPISEVAKLRRKKTTRAATSWCKKNGVTIYPHEKGRDRFVYTADFHRAYHKELYPHLVAVYGSKAPEALQLYMANDFVGLELLKEEGKAIRSNRKHVSQTPREKEILEEFTKKYIS